MFEFEFLYLWISLEVLWDYPNDDIAQNFLISSVIDLLAN